MSVTGLDRERLAKLLGMMGSAHDGEVVAAALQAGRLRAEAGLTWPQIIGSALPLPRRRHVVETAADAIEYILDYEDVLTPWERDFTRSLERQRSPLSLKQIAVLDQLLEKVRRAEAMAA